MLHPKVQIVLDAGEKTLNYIFKALPSIVGVNPRAMVIIAGSNFNVFVLFSRIFMEIFISTLVKPKNIKKKLNEKKN